MSKTPTIRKGPASNYASPGEAIYEFSDGASGGLISLRRDDAGQLRIEVYRSDSDVLVIAPRGQAFIDQEEG